MGLGHPHARTATYAGSAASGSVPERVRQGQRSSFRAELRRSDTGNVDIVFARVGVAAMSDGMGGPSRSYFAPKLFAPFADDPVPLRRSHDMSGPTYGVGNVYATESEAGWRGKLHDTAMANDLAVEMATLERAGRPVEASIHFSHPSDGYRTGGALTEDEAGFTDIVFDVISRVHEISIVEEGAVPGTVVSLNELVANPKHGSGTSTSPLLASTAMLRTRAQLRNTFPVKEG